MEEKWILSGYEFETKAEYEKAKKEAESVLYIKSCTNMTDMKQVLKVYNKAADRKMFHTIIGYEFMHQLYALLIKNKVMEAEYIKTIPVTYSTEKNTLPEDVESANKLSEQFRVLYEDAKAKIKQLKIVSVFLVGLIAVMIAMVYLNYRTYDEDAVLDKYSAWEAELEEREATIKEKEKQWNIDGEEVREEQE